ncbi:MAG: carbamoyl-phosphate synthase large subunit, partial [Beijerinckiaceae bacterium]
MPKRTDISTIMIIGAGPIIIGQASEFDYSGTQACKALREEGYRIVLVNSNPATIMTDPDMADRTYVEPITPEVVAKIIAQERNAIPGGFALLPTMGGQTALNCALSLKRMGVLEEYDVEMIGATAEAIDKAEDRGLFREAMTKIGLATPRSHQIKTLAQAIAVLDDIGLPAIIRPSFTLGGTGGGIAYNKEEFIDIIERGIDASPTNEVLVEESVLGWKEYEMEVVRDKADNCIIVCAIENVDPMGVHTGDSITVAPALTLTDKEYQVMRDASLAVLREIGVETGGSNVQFAVNPEDGRMVVIEMNPRVSRSSALASKATGFPIAKVAAKLAIGYTLDEIANDITGGATPASFEPAIDYVVTKIPRFAFEKFPGAEPTLTTSMKSVGEAMAIGRTFAESLQKALRSLETGLTGLDEIEIEGFGKGDDRNVLRAALGRPTPDRLLVVAQALRQGLSPEDIHTACRIDPWFIARLQEIVDLEAKIQKFGLPQDETNMRMLKAA